MSPPPKFPAPRSARLFGEPEGSSPAGVHTAYIDGASRGNPGPAAYAVLVRDPEGKTVFEMGKKFGRDTNNVAEYYGLLAALDYATSHGIRSLRIRSDSELLVRQMQGRYKVKSPGLKPLHERASRLARQISYFTIEHVPREMNREADALANAVLDSAGASSGAAVESSAAGRRGADSAGSSDSPPSPGSSPVRTMRVRARFSGGVLVPVEALNLPEGAEVALELRVSRAHRS
ncbi:MAG TPA: reverse transcriptase-like protein [Candidatus Acidoferrales bacterium]|nr:reverse transcriptase-like protein [Candidatus Acidoferrales bacterium]